MKRRGNKSHKVPNVKLRPADAGSYARIATECLWAAETQAGSDDTAQLDTCPRPFKNVVICATGVTDKPTIFKQAVELGAVPTPAFTDRVTHLIAESHGGAKYNCAIERKIPILKPSWITENYQIWLQGDDVELEESMRGHRLPIFSGVVMSLSGITDLKRQATITKILKSNEGQIMQNIERPVRVTHLLCSGDEITDKIQLAEKFNRKGEGNIRIVWEEWFWDSLDFGGRFDEDTYAVKNPRPTRKSLADPGTPPPPSSAATADEHDDDATSLSPPPPAKALQRSATMNGDEAEDEPAFVNVLPAITLQLWGGLLQKRGYQILDGEVILSPSKDTNSKTKKLPALPPSPSKPVLAEGASVISAFRRANSFAPVVTKETSSARQLPFRRTTTTSATIFGNNTNNVAGPSRVPLPAAETAIPPIANGEPQASPASVTKIFLGMTIRALGEAKAPNVRMAVEQLGGKMSNSEDEEVDFIVVRLISGSKIYRGEDDPLMRTKYRTECWLEKCLHEERICEPEENPAYVPLDIPLPVSGAEALIFAYSGFDQSEVMSLQRLFRALGINHSKVFSKKCTHLLCPSGKGPKFDKALEWNIPVVNMEFLRYMSTRGQILLRQDFLVRGPAEVVEPQVRPIDKKGKKTTGQSESVITDEPMEIEQNALPINDITNSDAPEGPAHIPSAKGKSISREPTIIVPTTQSSGSFSFGPPNSLLSNGTDSFGRSNSFGPPPGYVTPAINGEIPPQSPVKRHPASLARDGTLPQLVPQAEDGDFYIPSSKSPSPMKSMDPKKDAFNRASLSPAKLEKAASDLQQQIASLLGKRTSANSDQADSLAEQPANRAKRPRPQRSKVQLRQSSRRNVVEARSKAPTPPVDFESQGNPFADGFAGDDSFEGLGNIKAEDQSIRVMYEDPGQREEKDRILGLLKNDHVALPVTSSNSARRRTTRVGGF
ncbi:hypothetical protein CVT24_011721 [Panaeolus cyanescens]|uniref:BRCT domain-containing protein n=1 Tax=Panaeolus cyanescens TaxID=181874 RepID=A0A409YH90_9AGAR|nr:hypothetical protein CVT24_011721 [Panaeolus cyanescens]